MSGLLGTLGGIAGTLFGGPTGGSIGGLLGGMLDGNQDTNGGAGAKSETRDPWAAAQPYILANLAKNANLQHYYEQNPFNAQQKTGYQNQLNGIDHFNQNVAPGLLNFANQMTGSSYHRATGGAPGSAAGYGAAPGATPSGNAPTQGGPFSAPPRQSFGQVDWNAINPFSGQNKDVTQAPVSQTEANFDPAAYIAANPDVKADPWASTHPWEHFNGWGRNEGRKFTGKG